MEGFILFLTVLLVLLVGVGTSYVAASAIFRTMGQRTESRPAARLTTAVEASGR
jgi:hypothetical protein